MYIITCSCRMYVTLMGLEFEVTLDNKCVLCVSKDVHAN